ncbi:MAG: SsrA-binding protein SmpB [Candidatus Paceibacterota bacterium]|jgi:SsrA-binding protein
MARTAFQKDLVTNKKVYFDYEILEKFEAGIALLGIEVKSLKQSKASIVGAYVIIKQNQAFLLNTTISPYQPQNTSPDYKPQRTRKLLLKNKEINYLSDKTKQQRLTLIPLRVYNKNGLVKVEIALVKGKKKFDKRETIKKREEKRKIEKAQRGEY